MTNTHQSYDNSDNKNNAKEGAESWLARGDGQRTRTGEAVDPALRECAY